MGRRVCAIGFSSISRVGHTLCDEYAPGWPISLSTSRMARGSVRPYALDAERAKALWALSETLVGETF